MPVSAQALRVAARFQRAKTTENVKKLRETLKSMEEPLLKATKMAIMTYLSGPTSDEAKEAVAHDLSQAARHTLTELKIEFENPKLEDRAKHFLTRFKNLSKMIAEWAGAHNWETLKAVLQKQDTKALNPWQKYVTYRDEILGLVAHLDTEQEGHVDIGPWSVSLFTSPREDWNDEKIGKLQWVLQEGSGLLGRLGMNNVIGGRVYAYPSGILPGASGSHNALASYSPSSDRMKLAIGDNDRQLLHSMIHELGHRAYFKGMSGNARSTWDGFFDANTGIPDVDTLIAEWEAYASKKGDWEAEKYGRYLGFFYRHLKKDNPDQAMWLSLIAQKMDLGKDEKLHQLTGSPGKGSKPGLDALIENRGKVKVFLHPVTAYSATSPEELFAETFAHYAVHGAGSIPEILREMFHRVLPHFKAGSVSPRTSELQ